MAKLDAITRLCSESMSEMMDKNVGKLKNLMYSLNQKKIYTMINDLINFIKIFLRLCSEHTSPINNTALPEAYEPKQ